MPLHFSLHCVCVCLLLSVSSLYNILYTWSVLFHTRCCQSWISWCLFSCWLGCSLMEWTLWRSWPIRGKPVPQIWPATLGLAGWEQLRKSSSKPAEKTKMQVFTGLFPSLLVVLSSAICFMFFLDVLCSVQRMIKIRMWSFLLCLAAIIYHSLECMLPWQLPKSKYSSVKGLNWTWQWCRFIIENDTRATAELHRNYQQQSNIADILYASHLKGKTYSIFSIIEWHSLCP